MQGRKKSYYQALEEAQSPVRKSSRTRKIRKIVMDDDSDDDDDEEKEEEQKVDAVAHVTVKEEGDPEVIQNLKDNVAGGGVAPPIDPNAEMISVKVDPEAMTRREEEPGGPDDPLEEESQNKPPPSQLQQQNQPRPINSYILKECAEYTVDEVKLLLRVAAKFATPRVYLMCPICGSVETVKNLGNHLYQTHSAAAIRCPGKRCLGFRVNYPELAEHIQTKHFQVSCPKCDEKLDVRKLRHHQSVLCSKAPNRIARIAPAPAPNTSTSSSGSLLTVQPAAAVSQARMTVPVAPVMQSPASNNILPGIRTVITPQNGAGPNTPVVISHTYTGPATAKPAPLVIQPRQVVDVSKPELPPQVRSDQPKQNVIVLPKQPPLKIRPGVVPFAIPPKVAAAALSHASKDYEVMLRGKLVTIDGIFYYVKSDEVVFSDCPLCEDRSMACSILGSHLVTDHMLTSIPCYANGCDSIIQSNVLQEHLIGKHGKIQCRGCGFVLGIMTAKEHFDDEGNCTKTRPQFAVGPVVSSNPASGARLNSYDVSSVQPLLDKNDNGGSKSLASFDELGQAPPLPAALVEERAETVGGGRIPKVPCPHCHKQCSNLKKHIRDVHQPKTSCPICARRMGHSYLNEHMRIQHEGKEVPTRRCPLCSMHVQRLKNHLKGAHKMTKKEADDFHERYYPASTIQKPGRPALSKNKPKPPTQLTAEGLPIPETSFSIEDRILVFDD